MTRISVATAAAAAVWLGVTSSEVAHARTATPPPARQASLPDGEGKAVVEKLCGTCHGLDYVAPSRRTVRNWLETIELMKSFGAEATDEQWTTITNYLVASLAVLNANKAAADEFATLFRIDDKAAEAVVAYREKQGGFKTIDDLKKAPGLDAARIDALGDRLIVE
jgi:competence protein ComEA